MGDFKYHLNIPNILALKSIILKFWIFFFFNGVGVLLYHTGWNEVAWSRHTATSASGVQAILIPPDLLGLQVQAAMLS